MKILTCKCGRVLPLKRRKCGKCARKLIQGVATTTVVLNASTSGRNKRGIAGHKPDKIRTKRAKRQIVGGDVPQLRMMKW